MPPTLVCLMAAGMTNMVCSPTLYTSASLLGCFLELLAKHRPDTLVWDALADINDPNDIAAHDDETPPGAIGYDWLEGRQIGRADQVGRYCFVTHSRSVAAIDKAGLFAAHGIPSCDVDVALLKKVENRTLTRSIARWLYDLRGDDRNELVDGIEFRSRLGDEIRMWAAFERSPDGTSRHSNLITPEWSAPVTPDTPRTCRCLLPPRTVLASAAITVTIAESTTVQTRRWRQVGSRFLGDSQLSKNF
jgi:hypothetical protein